MASKKNTLGKAARKEASGTRTKDKALSSNGKNSGHQPTRNSAIKKARNFLQDKRTHRIFGASLIVLSVYLFIAFASYVVTWKIDHDKVSGQSILSFVINGDVQVDNWLGRLGAILSHVMIYNWFGLASYAIVFVFFLFGIRISTGIRLLPVWRSFRIAMVGMVVLSVFLGYISITTNRYLGGAFGYEISEWLKESTGSAGAFLLIALSIFSFVVAFFNPSFNLSFLKKDTGTEDAPETTAQEDTVKAVNTIRREDIPNEKQPEQPFEMELSNDEGVDAVEVNARQMEASTELDEPEKQESEEASEGSIEEQIDESFSVEAKKEDNVSEDELNAKLEEFGEYDPKLDLSSYTLPAIDLLEAHGTNQISINKEELEANKNNIVDTLNNYGISIEKIKATIGPTVTLYEIIPAAGVRISKIKNLEDDIALSLAALGIRIIAPIPGRGTIGI